MGGSGAAAVGTVGGKKDDASTKATTPETAAAGKEKGRGWREVKKRGDDDGGEKVGSDMDGDEDIYDRGVKTVSHFKVNKNVVAFSSCLRNKFTGRRKSGS